MSGSPAPTPTPTPTLAEAAAKAADRLDAAVQAVLGILARITEIRDETIARTTTIINNFINRPPQFNVWIDEINGDDAADGLTPATARRSIDKVIETMGSNATSISILSDVTIRKRHAMFAPLTLAGWIRSAAPGGADLYKRTVTFLPVAENSPVPQTGTASGGFFLYSPGIRTRLIDFRLPVAAGLNFDSHITCLTNNALSFDPFTLTVDSGAASALISVQNGRALLAGGVTFGANAAGHLFNGVAAGGNPNNTWAYDTNITSA